MTPVEHSIAVQKARIAAQVRRAAAWANVPETVLGIPLNPITPATASLLLGTKNAFLCGLPPVEADVKNFILYHSQDFNPAEPTPKFWPRLKIALRTERALCPLITPRNRRAGIRAVRFLEAVREIREIVSDTWADALPVDSSGDLPESAGAAATLQAQFVHIFAREYNFWPLAQPMEHTPLRHLFQLCRCADGVTFDRGEAAADLALLRAVNPQA